MYVLLDDCQVIVGHREGDFDFRAHLSQFFPYITSIHMCLWIYDPEALMFINL